ncbi:MAG: pyridoxal 5'-phosphate synthase glutaminase subunit PdxT [Selenomonas sp.]|jgi:5'-phosphate synthase pdxT subunit|nr:pyridoxal 5'-phosphate synthase glutaminase subunit PdxT [Selenomonas sp.]MDD7056084.1 pyridoxal 5'-phosphate synthase glutaminase subunit PdxT [Selenomonadaceae bacterium]HBT80089.1 pyridoxal 5'-phosphate synthase glutaminase subunit PdxT [Selenomonas sp.]
MRIAVLAVQGAFREHEEMLARLGCETQEIRALSDFGQPTQWDGIILPGGESTTQGKLLRELGLFQPLQRAIRDGLPVLATCAGLILLAEKLTDDPTVHLGTLPVTVRRNAYGRQLGSFTCKASCGQLKEVPMVFIRAPYIEQTDKDVEILATVDGHVVAVRYQNQLGLSFHPELTEDTRMHESFLRLAADYAQRKTKIA